MVKKKQLKKQDLSQPATKSDLQQLRQANKADLKDLRQATQHDLEIWGGELTRRIDRIEENMATKTGLAAAIRESEKRIIFEFKALAENIHRDVAGANKDEIESLKDADQKLDERVTVLEHKATAAR